MSLKDVPSKSVPAPSAASKHHRAHSSPQRSAAVKLGHGLPLRQGLRALTAGTKGLIGWRVMARQGHRQLALLGTVKQVDSLWSEGGGPVPYQLLRVQQQAELQPYGFKGTEVHLLPLVPDIIPTVHPQQRVLVATPPEGLLDLGRRHLLLSFLSTELLPYTVTSAAGQHAAAGGMGPRARALTEVRQMPTRSALLAAGRADLVALIGKVGGFTQAALQLGMRACRRPAGYWDSLEVLDMELDAFIAGCWVVLPCMSEEEEEEVTLAHDTPAAPQHSGGAQPSIQQQEVTGGSDDVYFYNTATRAIRWSLPPAAQCLAAAPSAAGAGSTGEGAAAAAGVGPELTAALLELQGERVMPLSGAVTAAGRWDLHQAITRHGGYTVVAQQLERRKAKALPAGLMTSGGLRAALTDVCSREGWPQGTLPTAQQLRDIDRSDLIRAISAVGGWRAAANLLNLRATRPTGPAWRTWTIPDLAQELRTFMATHTPTAAAAAVSASSQQRSTGPVHHQNTGLGQDKPASLLGEGQVVNQRLRRIRQGPEQQQQEGQQHGQQQGQQDVMSGWVHLPTQAQLIAAGRHDLVYGLRRYGAEAVAEAMALQPRYSRPRKKGVLQWSAVEAAVAAGCHSCSSILAAISQQQEQQQPDTQHLPDSTSVSGHATSADEQLLSSSSSSSMHSTISSASLSVASSTPFSPPSPPPEELLCCPVVSREHLQRQLGVWCRQGLLVKTGRSCYMLPQQCQGVASEEGIAGTVHT